MRLRAMRLPKGCILLLLPVAACMLIVVVWSNYVNTIPQAPVYANAKKVDESAYISEGMFYPMITSSYISADESEQVVQFYRHNGACRFSEIIPDRTICQGKAVPFGDFTIYIDKSNNPEISTEFIVEIRWER